MKHCRMCGTGIDNRRTYCEVCAAYLKKKRNHEYDFKRYREQREEQGYNLSYILVKDPSPDPLTKGMRIPVEEHKMMKKMMTYTPGTELKRGDERIRIELVGNKMVEVRI